MKMKFEYTFVTGKVSIDVDEEWVSILKDLDHEEAKNERKETRRHCSLDACTYEGESFVSEDAAFERFLESDSAKSLITPALEVLTKKQEEVVEALFYNHQTAKEFADSRGVCEMAVSKLRKAALKRIEVFLRKKV